MFGHCFTFVGRFGIDPTIFEYVLIFGDPHDVVMGGGAGGDSVVITDVMSSPFGKRFCFCRLLEPWPRMVEIYASEADLVNF